MHPICAISSINTVGTLTHDAKGFAGPVERRHLFVLMGVKVSSLHTTRLSLAGVSKMDRVFDVSLTSVTCILMSEEPHPLLSVLSYL